MAVFDSEALPIAERGVYHHKHTISQTSTTVKRPDRFGSAAAVRDGPGDVLFPREFISPSPPLLLAISASP